MIVTLMNTSLRKEDLNMMGKEVMCHSIDRFCKATFACREAALYYLEGFNWNFDDAISGFLRNQLPPVKKRLPPPPPQKWTVNEQRSRSRSPSRRRYSTTSVSESKCKMEQDEISITYSYNTALTTSLDDNKELHDSDDIFHGENKIVSMSDPVNVDHEFEEEVSSVRATKIYESSSTSIKTDLPFSDSGSAL